MLPQGGALYATIKERPVHCLASCQPGRLYALNAATGAVDWWRAVPDIDRADSLATTP